MKVIGFYDYRDEYGCFSNWYESDFVVDGKTYRCGEQYMMEQKALLFNAEETAQKIMQERSQAEIKRLGRTQIPEYDDREWDFACRRIMRKGLMEKFMQNRDLKQILLDTGDDVLAECALNDRKWGIGMDKADARVQYPHKWCGRNLLGYVLMQVRDDIRSLESGIKLSRDLPWFNINVQLADITTLKVDAIVNAANTSLLGGGGVDGAIHRAAGPQLLEECRKLNGAETGEVKITNGYRLPAKRIIHTPGPIWRGGNHHEDEQLANCWRRALCLLMEEKLHTIAFPSISTGVYGYPLKSAAEIAMRETVEFICNNPRHEIEVTVAAFDGATKTAYETALKNALTDIQKLK